MARSCREVVNTHNAIASGVIRRVDVIGDHALFIESVYSRSIDALFILAVIYNLNFKDFEFIIGIYLYLLLPLLRSIENDKTLLNRSFNDLYRVVWSKACLCCSAIYKA